MKRLYGPKQKSRLLASSHQQTQVPPLPNPPKPQIQYFPAHSDTNLRTIPPVTYAPNGLPAPALANPVDPPAPPLPRPSPAAAAPRGGATCSRPGPMALATAWMVSSLQAPTHCHERSPASTFSSVKVWSGVLETKSCTPSAATLTSRIRWVLGTGESAASNAEAAAEAFGFASAAVRGGGEGCLSAMAGCVLCYYGSTLPVYNVTSLLLRWWIRVRSARRRWRTLYNGSSVDGNFEKE